MDLQKTTTQTVTSDTSQAELGQFESTQITLMLFKRGGLQSGADCRIMNTKLVMKVLI